MPKRINNIYDDALTFSKIRDAYKRTSRRKKKNNESITFGMYLEDNILDIYKKLKNETYKVGKYKSFKVYEPKDGCVYCGYRVFLDHRLIKRANINRVKKRIRGWNNKWKNGIYDFKIWNQSFNSWKGYAKHANSYRLIKSLNKKMEYIYENENWFKSKL